MSNKQTLFSLSTYFVFNQTNCCTMAARNKWKQYEDDLIKLAIDVNGIQKWPVILSWIKNKNQTFIRTPKQIRQRWKYHLNPSINTERWSRKQEEIVFKSHMIYGSKWKQIQKLLDGRTQKSIKNYFYMTLRKSIRQISKAFGIKNSTMQVRQIKPIIFNYLVQIGNENPILRQSIYQLFHFCKKKENDKELPENFSRDEMGLFREIIDDITFYNDMYQLDKKKCVQTLVNKIENLKNTNTTNENESKKCFDNGASSTQGFLLDEEQEMDEDMKQSIQANGNQQCSRILQQNSFQIIFPQGEASFLLQQKFAENYFEDFVDT